MLLYHDVGDTYGAGFEYADDMLPFNTLEGYVQNSTHKALLPGRYTDDTQMAIAIAELMISLKEWTPLNIANKFVEVFKRDEREGYARRFQQFLEEIQSGEEFLRHIKNDSDKSGGAMRATPIGLYKDIEVVKERSAIQAAVTHNTPDGIDASIAASLMTHYFIYKLGPKRDIGTFLNDHLCFRTWNRDWNVIWDGKVGSKGWQSVTAAITAIRMSSTLSEVLKNSVAFSGDVDTVAAVALAAGSMSSELENDIPKHLINGLENGKYGRDYIENLNNQLFEL